MLKKLIRLPIIPIFIVSLLMWITSWVLAPTALALTQLKLSDISYHECPADIAAGSVSSGTTRKANCFIITGKAQNNTNKIVLNADIFGRIYDANNNNIMPNRTRLGSIDEVPPGVTDFEFRISVDANQPTPLQLKQFKATGFSGTVRR